jgi:hypothetical protein
MDSPSQHQFREGMKETNNPTGNQVDIMLEEMGRYGR